jgi:hypothetical protein
MTSAEASSVSFRAIMTTSSMPTQATKCLCVQRRSAADHKLLE